MDCRVKPGNDDDKETAMCRNIRTLFNFEPPATEDEIRASALQFVRKLSGFAQPSRVNEAAFNLAVHEISASARRSSAHWKRQAQARIARKKPKRLAPGHASVSHNSNGAWTLISSAICLRRSAR
jgi:hypothetical protein